jgi:hypothetical protein
MRGYRVSPKKLWAVVGSPKLQRAISKAGKAADLIEDPRLPAPFATLLDEVHANRLAKPHALGYRILLEPAADTAAKRIKLDVNRLSKGYPYLRTYAVRNEVAKVLRKLGAPFTAKSWDQPTCPWPWLRGAPKVRWPSASFYSPADVTYRARELENAGARDKALDERLVPIVGEPNAAAEMGDVIRSLHGIFRGAQGAAALILLDGEQ